MLGLIIPLGVPGAPGADNSLPGHAGDLHLGHRPDQGLPEHGHPDQGFPPTGEHPSGQPVPPPGRPARPSQPLPGQPPHASGQPVTLGVRHVRRSRLPDSPVIRRVNRCRPLHRHVRLTRVRASPSLVSLLYMLPVSRCRRLRDSVLALVEPLPPARRAPTDAAAACSAAPLRVLNGGGV